MRNVINISLPQEMARAVEKNVKLGNFASKSEFFRMLFRLWMEGKLAEELEESRQELRRGEGTLLLSLKGLR
ncbi:MAG: ribbon-helix-helix protein, CopG family [Candidatus Colwellbacteria bacterium]|nr:ribbon-helix-helix protein, CopG family [Candidatus Colwellbacteria bacterium]